MTAEVIDLHRGGGTPSPKTLLELRQERGWSHMDVVKAMMAAATEQERKGLPDPESLKKNWMRWEHGTEPDGRGRSLFFKPIIARMFGMDLNYLFPPVIYNVRSQSPGHSGDLHRELVRRRDLAQQEIIRLQADVAYLNSLLSVPAPAPFDRAQ